MSEPHITSAAGTWMRPYWAELHRDPFFGRLAPDFQAEALAKAVEADYPNEARDIREWNPATRRVVLAMLDDALRERATSATTELWRVRKGGRELCCVAVHVVTGIDLRLLEGGEMLRTELFRDGVTLLPKSHQWRQQLESVGWSAPAMSAES